MTSPARRYVALHNWLVQWGYLDAAPIPVQSSPMYSPQEAAVILGYSDVWVRALIKKGELSAIRRGRYWYIPQGMLEDYQNQNEKQKSKTKKGVGQGRI